MKCAPPFHFWLGAHLLPMLPLIPSLVSLPPQAFSSSFSLQCASLIIIPPLLHVSLPPISPCLPNSLSITVPLIASHPLDTTCACLPQLVSSNSILPMHSSTPCIPSSFHAIPSLPPSSGVFLHRALCNVQCLSLSNLPPPLHVSIPPLTPCQLPP